MIKSKADYKEYYICDLKASELYKSRNKIKSRLTDRRYVFYKWLRKAEYYTNCRSDFLGKVIAKYMRLRYEMICNKYMWQIPINTCGKGLQLVHVGPIIISGYARIGDYARIHVGVNIGRAYAHGKDGAPEIGNCCYMGPGTKIFGPVVIGDNVAIGANAVVNKSFDSNCTVGGMPAKIISHNTSEDYIIKG